MGKLCWEVKESHYDLVVVDASASGHVVGQLAAPQAINQLVQVGLVRQQTGWMLDILGDPATDRRRRRGHAGGDAGERDPRADRADTRARPTSTWLRSWSTGSCPSCSAGARRRSSSALDAGPRLSRASRRCSGGPTSGAAMSAGAPDRVHAPLEDRAPRAVCGARSTRESRCSTCRTCSSAPTASGPPTSSPKPCPPSSATDGRPRWPSRCRAGPAGEHRGPCRLPGDRHRLRLRRGGQDDHGGGHRGHGGGQAGRQGAGGHRRPGPPTRQRSRPRRRSATKSGGSTRRRSADGRRPPPRRAVGSHARHQAELGRPGPPPRSRPGHGAADPVEPAVPEHLREVRPEPRLHRDGAALRAALRRPLRPDRGRHPAVAQRPRLHRGAAADGRLLLVEAACGC